MDNAQSYLFSATRHLNDLTGYTSIEALKTRISTLETHTSDLRSRVRAAKTAYNAAITNRSSSQREVNGLLQRKHAWTPADLERFTALYRSDHANEVEETRAGEELAAAERKADEAQTALGQAILERYHEEQVWSDKIRRMSTWGTWGLMGVNVLLFVVFQVVVEPWRRKRLVKGFEEKVKEAIEGDRGVRGGDGGETTGSREGSVSEALAEEGPVLAEEQVVVPSLSVGTDISPLMELASPPAVGMARYQVALRDLFSDRTISIRKSDVTTIALEGAAAGATFVGVLCYVLTKRG
ncbi:MAG: sensitivity to high expression protein she9 [Piccolia ochrophora]|nr:MAG: sensitivity to high expression protein she9 [Piccolia ochrophora]